MSGYKRKFDQPLSEQLQFRGTEIMANKVRAVAKTFKVEEADVLRAMVLQYTPHSSHFTHVKKEKP